MAKLQYRLKVYPAGLRHKLCRNLEIFRQDTLDRLCDAVLEAFAFSKEQLYEFCMKNQMYQDDNYRSDPEDGKLHCGGDRQSRPAQGSEFLAAL